MRAYVLYISTFILFSLIEHVVTTQLDNETVTDILGNAGFSSLQLANKYGYPIERHKVITEDGYIIEMHRVPYGINNTDRSNRPPVVIGHGAGGAGMEFFVMGRRSLGFALVEAGYDVWVGNSRGTPFSRRHKTLDPRSKQFWMYSWHEIGKYDYSAEIDYVTNVTGQVKVFFIGHSQGCTAFAVMAAEKPEMYDKVRLAILMGPSVFTKHNKTPLVQVVTENIGYVEAFFNYIHVYEITNGAVAKQFLMTFCRSVFGFLCQAFVFLLMGYDTEQIDRRIVNAVISNYPAGISVRQVVHYGQIYRSERFQKYDYGKEENLKRYGTEKPPLYDISKITAPVALMYSKDDNSVDYRDVDDLAEALPNCAFKYLIEREGWNHIAFLVATEAPKLVNEKIIEMMRQY